MKIINRKANFNYELLEKFEAGLVLNGAEVKSVRNGHIKLEEAFIKIKDGEAWLFNAHIHPYSFAIEGVDPYRARKLLLHKKQLMRLIGDVSKKGVTLIPLCMYFNNKGLVKVELGVCKHKSGANKKQEIKERDIKRETEREIKDRF